MGKFRPIAHEIWDAPPPAPLPPRSVKACRKETVRRFKALREPSMPAEVVALGLLKARCARCAARPVCWRP